MKSILFSAVFIICAVTSQAQFTEQGQKVIGGTVNFNSSNYDNAINFNNDGKDNNFGASINAGKFVKKNVLSTVSLSFLSRNSRRANQTVFTKQNLFTLSGSYNRTYFKEIAKKFYFGIGGYFGLSYNQNKLTDQPYLNLNSYKAYQASIGLLPVLDYQLTKRLVVGLSPNTNFLALNYIYYKTKYTPANQPEQTGKITSVNLDAGFFSSPLSNLSLNFTYLLKH